MKPKSKIIPIGSLLETLYEQVLFKEEGRSIPLPRGSVLTLMEDIDIFDMSMALPWHKRKRNFKVLFNQTIYFTGNSYSMASFNRRFRVVAKAKP